MRLLHRILFAGIFGTAAATAGIAQAQTAEGHDHHSAAPSAKPAAQMSEGEVRKIDLQGRKITLQHGPLKNLDMPAMTMAFQVSDAAMLTKVKVGDKVRFVATNPAGKLTVTDIQLAPK